MDDDTLASDELRVLAALACSASAAAAAERLSCDLVTFGEQLVDIRAKLHADSTKAALAMVRARGLI